MNEDLEIINAGCASRRRINVKFVNPGTGKREDEIRQGLDI